MQPNAQTAQLSELSITVFSSDLIIYIYFNVGDKQSKYKICVMSSEKTIMIRLAKWTY